MQKHIVVVGNPVEGYHFIGPFVSVDAAVDFCGGYEMRNEEWHPAPLEDPTQIEPLVNLGGEGGEDKL